MKDTRASRLLEISIVIQYLALALPLEKIAALIARNRHRLGETCWQAPSRAKA
jgi:hypothetical protein